MKKTLTFKIDIADGFGSPEECIDGTVRTLLGLGWIKTVHLEAVGNLTDKDTLKKVVELHG